jgi:myo-inositol 2-dehydrogenase/D-chiro-inositol 1-dehydrogenase
MAFASLIGRTSNQYESSPMSDTHLSNSAQAPEFTRRQFLARTGSAALGVALVKPALISGSEANSKINIGLIGCGGRGQWIIDLFDKHGGYNVVAAADYFQDRVDKVGERFKLEPAHRYTGLSGYRRLLEQNLDAVVIQSPPYFHPEHAAAAIEAGKHVYLAKPIGVDVPGCRSVGESGKAATEKKLCFQVDFQTRAHPAYQEVVRRVQAGEIGPIVSVESNYQTGTMFAALDAQLRAHPEDRELKLRAWALDRALSGDVITEQNIHALDVVSWFMNAEPIRAYGTGGRAREFVGSCWDHFAVIFYYPNNVIVSFSSKQVGFGYDDIMCRVYGAKGTADTHYDGKVTMRSNEDAYNGSTPNLYTDGAVRNIATFHQNVVDGACSNPSVAPSVRSNLVTILGRTAAYRNREVAWDEILKANEKLEADLRGLKV